MGCHLRLHAASDVLNAIFAVPAATALCHQPSHGLLRCNKLARWSLGRAERTERTTEGRHTDGLPWRCESRPPLSSVEIKSGLGSPSRLRPMPRSAVLLERRPAHKRENGREANTFDHRPCRINAIRPGEGVGAVD